MVKSCMGIGHSISADVLEGRPLYFFNIARNSGYGLRTLGALLAGKMALYTAVPARGISLILS